MNTDYPSPVDQFLTLGEIPYAGRWQDYSKLGIGKKDIPHLIKMATDSDLNSADSESLEVWAPAHAWRALGQLRAEEAIVPLVHLFNELKDDDWAQEELPIVLGMIGEPAIPHLVKFLADPKHSLYPRIRAAWSLREVAQRFQSTRIMCISALTDQLRQHDDNNETLNGFIISDLLDLNAHESISVIESAFAAGTVDTTIGGDWQDAQMALGLIDKRSTPREHRGWGSAFSLQSAPKNDSGRLKKKKKPRKAKRKRKQAKKSRRKNRKK